ncbi:fibrous sheath-interacting protein 1 [Anabrus simplex]|uniref:fibrous sheath-interacting protein 1 n=1 Tax=Anabrus simplex TaxID=316456 RepID=UPI0035A343B4
MNKIKKLKTYIYDDKAYSPEESSVGDLSDKRTLDEIAQELNALHTEPVDSTKWNNNSNDGTLQSAFAKMNKLDALLRVTETREKEAREETLKLQLEIRRELEKIYSSENENVNVNSSLFKNTAAFYQLCPLVRKKVKEEGGETGENKFPSVLRENVQINLDANNNEAEQADEEKWHEKKDTVPDIHSTDEDAASANEEEDNKKGVKRVKKKLPHFILRNIKLASEGMGTLSITDEEKERLSKLLKDIDNEDQEKKKTDEKGDALKDNDTDEDETEYVGNNEEYGGYTMDPQVEQNLKEIDSKLELLSSNGSLSSDTSHPNINIGHCQENVGNEIQDDSKRGWKEAKLKKRLHEIDSSLLNFTQPVEEPVEPLRETEIQKIIEELSSGHSSSADTESETSFKTPEDVPLPTIPLRERTFDSVATYGSKDSELRNDFTPTPISTVRTTPTPSLSTERSDQDLRWPPHLKSEVVQQLVEQAKALMPYFKFKHNV